ncbi:hypothetical protein [Variovorax sp. W2I14]|uniref:hypothetical protein n=1 Tax=Variovorax sp. W2I14 TaxID=3042290 RepID=UPI003D19E6B1
MTSPLQAAHDQAVEAGPEPIVCTVAAPRTSAMTGVYMGEHLSMRSSRPGAYDAMALPSLFSGQKRDPAAPKAIVSKPAPPEQPLSNLSVPPLAAPVAKKAGPAREFPTVHREKQPYRPHQGSVPHKVIEHLRAFGGFLNHFEISAKFGIHRTNITAVFKPALKGGALIRHLVDGHVGYALPDWQPPEASASPRPLHIVHASGHVDAIRPGCHDRRFWQVDLHNVSPLTNDEATGLRTFLGTVSDALYRPAGQDYVAGDATFDADFDPEQLSALYALSLREAELALLLGYIAVLQLRKQLFDVTRALPLSPLTEPPRLTDAA